MIIAGQRRAYYDTTTTQSNLPLIFSTREESMDFKSNGSTATSYDAFAAAGMMSSSNVPSSSNPSFNNYVSSFQNYIPQHSASLLATENQQSQHQQPQQQCHSYPQQQQHTSSIELQPSYVTPITSGSTIATTSTDYFKPPADINDKIVKDEVIVDEHQTHSRHPSHHHHNQHGIWSDSSRPGQDPIVNMVMMGGGVNSSNSGGSGGYPDDSLVTPCTYYSPSSAIQSSPSSEFSPPPNLFLGTNNSINSNSSNIKGMASFGRPQPYIKRRRSSALAITPVHDAAAAAAAIVDDNNNAPPPPPHHHHHQQQQKQHESVIVTAATAVAATTATAIPSHFYSPIPSQPTLNVQSHHRHHQQQQPQQHYVATSGSTSTMVTPTSSATGTPSPCSFPGSASSSSSAGQPMVDQRNANILLRFNIILQASTAATQISEGSPTTYLNRGQAYAIHLQDTYEHDINITSTFIIMFHEPSHRKVALNYWKFWLGQQKNPTEARAVTLDQDQSVGVHNIRFPSFDRITFDWNGRYGAKVFIRFNCLSTDFSRIKGVKGIPLRAQMETKTTLTPQPSSGPQILANTLQHQASSLSSSSASSSADNSNEYIEQCYCKVKLFRDKGAERKNKDDAKQIGKHLERVYAEGNPRQHPFWLMYNQPKPYSVFSEIPTTPQASETLFPTAIADNQQNQQSNQVPSFQQVDNSDNSINTMGNLSSPSSNEGSLGTVNQSYMNQQQQASQQQHKRSYSQVDRQSANILDISATVPVSSLTLSDNSSSTTSAHITATTTAATTGLSLYVNVKTTQHQRFHSPPSPTATPRSRTDKKKLQHIVLEHVAVQELIAKLCPVLSLHYSQVSEVLWRQPKSTSSTSTTGGPPSAWDSHGHHRRTTATSTKAALARANGSDSTLVRVDDKVLSTGFANDTVVGVEWEIKSDGTVRLLLQQ